MSDLIIGVVMDVVLHLILNNLQGVRVGLIATAARNFVILDAAEFVVLDPKVGLEYSCAAANRRRAASPGVRPPLASAVRMLGNSPAPMVPAPTASVAQERTATDEPFPRL